MLALNQIYNMDCLEGLKLLDSDSIQMAVTSPPYWSLRTYDCDGQIGQEDTPGEYIERLCAVFAEVHRVLKPDGGLFDERKNADCFFVGTRGCRISDEI
jgi:DNA modification methylase